MWRTEEAPELAARYLGDLGSRWDHVENVGRLADWMVAEVALSPEIAVAAWLHDIGYAPVLADTGFHPVDGASFLADEGASDRVVSLVAHHTGARFEAEERGLERDLDQFAVPEPDDLDTLTLLDLVSSPTGAITTPRERIDEILTRYPESHPVHRAITRSRPELLASASRARVRLGLSDVWPAGVLERVGEPQPH
ncbi:HD domain-containing protein [Knoellia aerolata]|uniref:Phosphohydrolase n=1 Tax=Knoellia aerolata DSM 18566 TaxID=1385519 RepID=A0A0A0JUJ3_9MICO|nr:HD domain-containing protein [Knoellia aerolata]KGN40823.1 phosphohydrolase [Knoellia aerolata DSM 18566]